MRRSVLPVFLSCLSLSACKRVDTPESKDPDDDGDERSPAVEADGTTPTGEGRPLYRVRQLLSPEPYAWSFAPDRALIAAPINEMCGEFGCCGIWDITSGSFVTSVPDAPESPCTSWTPSESGGGYTGDSADGVFSAEISGNVVELFKGGGEIPVATLQCQGCSEVLALAWAPEGHHLAAVTRDPVAIEVWDIDRRQRVRQEPFSTVDPSGAMAGWNQEGLVVVLGDETQIAQEDYGYDGGYDEGYEDGDDGPSMIDVSSLSIYRWPAGGGPLIERRHAAVSVGLDEVTADPGLRWMFWMHYDGGRRSSSYELVNLATGTVNSGLEWSQSEYGNYGYYEETERDGYWRSDLSTSWIEQFMETSGNYDDGTLTMGWGALSVEPEPAVYQQIVIDGANSNDTAELELYAANAGDALMSWTHCKDDESDCREEPLVIADCEPLDGSPQLNLVLAECETGLALVEPGLPRRRDRPGRIVARLPLRPDADYRWGRGGTLALSEPGGRFAVVDPMTGAIGLERGDVDGFAEVAMAVPRNWQGVISKGFLEIIDLGTGKTVVRVPEPIGRAGISPDGRRLAVARPTIEIWSLEAGEFDGQAHQAGELLSKLSIPEIDKEEHKSLDVAWRQDGAALLIGHGVPELQYTLADRQTLALNLEDVDEEQVDPSWRWIHLEEHEIMRLLDRRVLSYEPAGTSGVDGWARLDDGQFEGAPPPDDGARYRADEDPMAPPIFSFSQVERWLRRPNLVRDFFAGAPLPPAAIPEAEYAKLTKGDN